MADRDILTITLNPALDVDTRTARVHPGEKLRCGAPVVNPGGGGLNVSRALAHLGGQSRALVALGGATGAELAGLLRAEAIAFAAVESPGPTRQSLTVTETATGQQYRFVLPGPDWQAADLARLIAALGPEVRPGGIAVLSGSQPPGVPSDFAAELARALPGMALVLDTSGPPLAAAIAQPIPGLAILRMDSAEAESLAGHPLTTATDTADFAQTLTRAGAAQVVIIARGAEGNVLVTGQTRLLARPPSVTVVSAVGAGDSFVAGLVLAMARGQTWQQALTLGTAAAAAAVLTPATELCRAEDVATLLPQVHVAAL